MKIKIDKLKKRIEKTNKFMIYGYGYIGKQFLNEAGNNNIDVNKVIVTQKTDDLSYDERVFEINSIIDEISEDVFVLITVGENLQNEIINILTENNINNFDVINSYIYDIKEEINLSEKSNDEAWLAYLNREKHNFDITNISGNSFEYIAIVIGDFSVRVIKIANALLNEGKRIKLFIMPECLERDVCKQFITENDNIIIRCECITELFLRVMTEHIKIIHIMTYGGHSHIDRTLIEHKNILCPIVYDDYDILNYFYIDIDKKTLRNEKYCIENADGICNRGYEYEFLIEKDWDIKGKWIQFHDYCCKELNYQHNEDKEELSICYVGGIFSLKKYQDSSYAGLIDFAKMCRINKCHIHVYPSYWDKDEYSEYILEEANNPYFHIHATVPFNEMLGEISKYDYGFFPVKSDFLEKKYIGYYSREKAIYGTANKFFDYLDAGLPFVSPQPVKLMEYFKQFGVVKQWTIEEIDFDYLRKNKIELKDKVKKAHEELMLSKNVHNLIGVYDELLEKR